tara:strand:+ start:1665 stop:3464 length:1800 start_codon:yes stop_codon:yes gene_type:complete
MPVADVSDLMSKRNLVEEAQGWLSLDLQKKEQARKELESKKKDALKPFDWEMADWGSDNPYFQEQLQDLSQDYYNHVYSMAPYLSMNPGDMENCPPGSPCAEAHRLKNTLDGTAGAFKSFQTRFKNDYDAALDLLGDKDSIYYNQDNLQALENAKGEWMKGFKPSYNQDGRLMAIVTETEKVPQKDEDGNPIYLTESGDTTTNKDDAKIGDDGNPVQATADQEVEKMITLDEYYDKLGISKDKLKKNASANDWNPETFSELITPDSSFIGDDGVINKNNKNYKTTYTNLHGAIFGATDMYNPNDPEGSVLTANAAPIINMMRNDPSGNFKEGSITKDQIIDYVIQNVMGYDGVDGDGSGGGFDMAELISRMSDHNHVGELSTYNVNVGGDANNPTYEMGEADAIAYEGMFTIEHGGKEEGQTTSATFSPDEVTLIGGDGLFRSGEHTIEGLGKDLEVTYHDAYLCLWDPDQGKFLTKSEEANLTNEQKAKCEYRPAIQVTFHASGTSMESSWNGKGISTDGGKTVKAIMPLDQARSQIQGDYSEKSSNFQKTEAMDELAKRKTEELRSGVITDSSTGGTEGEESDQDTEDPDAFDPNDY